MVLGGFRSFRVLVTTRVTCSELGLLRLEIKY